MPQKPIRVLQVGMSDNYGGTEAVVYGVYNHLDHSKIQFDFLNVYGHPIAKQEELVASGAHIYDLLLKRREGYFKYIRGIKDFYKHHAAEFDTVVCNVQCLDQIDMLKWAKYFGIKKRILYLHNAGNGIQPSKMAKIAIAINKRHARRYATTFVAVSSLAAAWGFSKKDARNCTIIPDGIDMKHFAFSDNERRLFRQTYGFSENDRIYGSAGRFDPQKNPFFLLSIFSAVHRQDPQAKFLWAGRGPLEAKLRERIAQSGLKDSLVLVTNLNDLSAFYSALDFFIFPSLFEGLGLVLLEAQCSGLPCFATSETIPTEIALSANYRSIGLDQTSEQWAALILSSPMNNKRDCAYQLIAERHFDIETNVASYSKLLVMYGNQ